MSVDIANKVHKIAEEICRRLNYPFPERQYKQMVPIVEEELFKRELKRYLEQGEKTLLNE